MFVYRFFLILSIFVFSNVPLFAGKTKFDENQTKTTTSLKLPPKEDQVLTQQPQQLPDEFVSQEDWDKIIAIEEVYFRSKSQSSSESPRSSQPVQQSLAPPPVQTQQFPDEIVDQEFLDKITALEEAYYRSQSQSASTSASGSQPSGHIEEEEFSDEESSSSGEVSSHLSLEPLTTYQEHMGFLKKAIAQARHSILITSYGIKKEIMSSLYGLFKAAHKRGVSIYIYNCDTASLGDDVLKIFGSLLIPYRETRTHAKILAIDSNLISIGSFNWFGTPKRYSHSLDRTLVLQGNDLSEIREQFWKHITYQRNLDYGNGRQVRRYERNPFNQETISWDLGASNILSYLHSIESHQAFIQDSLKTAKRRVIFSSPFISENSGYQWDFTRSLLWAAIKRGVEVTFVVQSTDKRLTGLKRYFGTLLRQQNFNLVEKPGFHFKTAIVDDKIVEGSFNWLQTTRDEMSDNHKFESTLICEGPMAKSTIQNFYQTEIAPFVRQSVPSSRKQSKKRKGTYRGDPSLSKITKSKKKAVFSHREEQVQQPQPRWYHQFSQDKHTARINGEYFEVLSGRSVGKRGYCVRINKREYLSDEFGNILYFKNAGMAKEAASDA